MLKGLADDLNVSLGQALYYLDRARESLARLQVMNPDYDLFEPLPQPWMDNVLTLLEEHVILDCQMAKGLVMEVLHPILEVMSEKSVSSRWAFETQEREVPDEDPCDGPGCGREPDK
jgi:hypothetical protein